MKASPRTKHAVARGRDARLGSSAPVALRAMIPRTLPSVEGVDMASLYMPCQGIAGNLFDVVQLRSDMLALVMIDVAGQGPATALVAAAVRICIDRHLGRTAAPAVVMERVERESALMRRTVPGIDLFIGYLDLHDNCLTYCASAGMAPTVFRAVDRTVHRFPGTVSSARAGAVSVQQEQRVPLNPADWLLICTNGLYRSLGSGRSDRGDTAFRALIPGLPAEGTPARLCTALTRRCRGARRDGIALIVVEILSQSRRFQVLERLGFDPRESVYLRFINYFEEMDDVIGTVLRGMDNLGYDNDVIRKMKISLTELIVNALEHGNRRNPSKRVAIGHAINREKVTVSIMDEGTGFDPVAVPDPTLPHNLSKNYGRGLYIARRYSDEISFNDAGNRVTITRHRIQTGR